MGIVRVKSRGWAVVFGLVLAWTVLAWSTAAVAESVTAGQAQPASVAVSPGPSPQVASGTVSGTILWTDFDHQPHPVRGALVQFFDGNANFLGVNTATDQNGHYAAGVSTPTNSVQVRVFTQDPANARIAVAPPSNLTYRWEFFSGIVAMNGDVSVPLTFPAPVKGTDPSTASPVENAARAFSVFDGMMTFWDQFNTLAVGIQRAMPRVLVAFPWDDMSPGSQDINLVFTDALSWDALGWSLANRVALGVPARQIAEPYNTSENSALTVQWREGLALFLSLAIQEAPLDSTFAFPTSLAGVKDKLYRNPEFGVGGIDPESPPTLGGATSANSILGLLWDLFTTTPSDSDGVVAEFAPRVSVQTIWNALTVNLPCNPCDRVDRLWVALVNWLDTPTLLQVAKDFVVNHIAPEAQFPVDGATLNPGAPPTFSWVAPPDLFHQLANTTVFYLVLSRDHFQTYQVLTGPQTATSFTPTQDQWTQVLGANPAGNYQWLVAAAQPIPNETLVPEGFYWLSNAVNFSIGTGEGIVTVTVNDAVTGQPIAGATVSGTGGLSASTDASGQATFSNVLAGNVTVTATATGYITKSTTVTVVAGQNNPVTISLAPVGDASTYRIVLNWGADPRDLDLHLTGPAPDGSRFHIYYANPNRGPSNDPALPSLDHDITTGFGPETITIPSTARRAGVYRASIHHFAGNSTMCATRGQITATLYLGGSQVNAFAPPGDGCAGVNDVWTVFELTIVDPNNPATDTYTPVGTITNGVTSANVQAVLGGPGQPEDPALFQDLPAKKKRRLR